MLKVVSKIMEESLTELGGLSFRTDEGGEREVEQGARTGTTT